MSPDAASITVELRGQSYAHDAETGERLSRITIFRELAEELGLDPNTPTTVTMTLSLSPSLEETRPEENGAFTSLKKATEGLDKLIASRRGLGPGYSRDARQTTIDEALHDDG